MAYMRNFGHDGPEEFNGLGINGKMSEFHAAMGLCVLDYANEILEKRKEQCEFYDDKLASINAKRQQIQKGCTVYNYAYYPILFASEKIALKVKQGLEKQNIFPRRYFYPLLNSLGYVNNEKKLPAAKRTSDAILCLPLFHDLRPEEQELVTRIILRTLRYG
jgi:dTDP-4-amino-4,6-dideoxygalactose transaminase